MKYIWFLLLLLFVGCEVIKLPTEYEPELNIFAVLYPDRDSQMVFLGHTYKATDTLPNSHCDDFIHGFHRCWSGVSGAQVRISYDSAEVDFEEINDSLLTYYAAALQVLPGKSYCLEVVYQDDTIYTTTTVPETFAILNPQDGDTVNLEDTLAWEESVGAKSYLLEGAGEGGFTDLGHVNRISFRELYIRSDDIGWLLEEGEEELDFCIWAVDTNYYDYYRIGKYNADLEPSMHIDGGLGVFGSITKSDWITIVVKP